MYTLFSVFLAHCDDLPKENTELQAILMRKSLRPKTSFRVEKIDVVETRNPSQEPDSDFCSWKGVFCQNGVVKRLESEGNSFYQVTSLDYLPPTIRRIDFSNKPIDRIMHTRRLPHELRLLRVYRCKVHGRLDLCSLPEHCVEVHLRSNSLSGNLDLSCLPQSLEVLDLSYNLFLRVLIINSLLPRGLREVHIYSSSGKMETYVQDAKKADVRIYLKSGKAPVVSTNTFEHDDYDQMKSAKMV
mmetsp:Transcript_11601/g.17573  ORF Transcript_11601/g.17573 Transcript_11601/m.17573 type:complete len:243 (-) Transcript_11601:14-742(-)